MRAAPKFTPTTGSQGTSTRHSTQSEVEPALVAREKDRSGQEFTRGPWEVRRNGPYVDHVGGGTVARAYAGGCAAKTREDKAQELANARLIAAAPDLYEALRDMHARHCEHFCRSEHDAECVAAKFALARVEAQ